MDEKNFGDRLCFLAGEQAEAALADRVAENQNCEAGAEGDIDPEPQWAKRCIHDGKSERCREGDEFALEISHFEECLESFEIKRTNQAQFSSRVVWQV
ncbi:MAG: hypothetical protein WA476_05060 [Acidobacteriaceae bacterium]